MRLQITVGKDLYQVQIQKAGDGYEVIVNGKPCNAKAVPGGFSIGAKVHKVEIASNQGGVVQASIDGKTVEAIILDIAKTPAGKVAEVAKERPVAPAAFARSARTVSAPMPGKIARVLVSPGQAVKVGDVLLILEAMKMENEIMSPFEGKVKEVMVTPGAGVAAEEPLVVVE